MKSSSLLLAIYTENKPSAEYAQRLVEKHKIAIKNIKNYVCNLIIKEMCWWNP